MRAGRGIAGALALLALFLGLAKRRDDLAKNLGGEHRRCEQDGDRDVQLRWPSVGGVHQERTIRNMHEGAAHPGRPLVLFAADLTAGSLYQPRKV